MLRIWLPLQDVGEFRNIDKRKTNVKTELMIEGGYENFHLHLRGLRKFFHRFLGGYMEIYVLEISFILHPPLVITL
jgi:hypothetical protein